MDIGTAHLFIPGPTQIPEDVRRAMMVPMQDHRAPAFGDLLRPILSDLAPVFGTREARIALIPDRARRPGKRRSPTSSRPATGC